MRNLSLELKEYLPQRVFNLLENAGIESGNIGQNLFLVGGVVRDLFLGRANLDLDVVVEGDAIKLAQRLAKSDQLKAVLYHRFGTAKLNFDDFSLDIVTARRESYGRPGVLPDVQPGTITDDLFRRDFSINAMALYLTPEHFGDLVDLYQGQQDIEKHLIRVLHPNSFIDDATRIFRAIRYEQRLEFTIEHHTAEFLVRDIPMLRTISGDRLRHELILLLKEEYPELLLKRAAELGVLNELNLPLRDGGWLNEKFEQARQLDKSTSVTSLYLCLLIYNLTTNENMQLMSRLNFPKKLAEATHQTLQLKAQLAHFLNPELKPSNIYRLLNVYMTQAVQANMLAAQSEIVKQSLYLYLTKLRYVKPLLNGDDLRGLGVLSGNNVGEILGALHEARLNGEVKTRQDEEKLVRRWLSDL